MKLFVGFVLHQSVLRIAALELSFTTIRFSIDRRSLPPPLLLSSCPHSTKETVAKTDSCVRVVFPLPAGMLAQCRNGGSCGLGRRATRAKLMGSLFHCSYHDSRRVFPPHGGSTRGALKEEKAGEEKTNAKMSPTDASREDKIQTGSDHFPITPRRYASCFAAQHGPRARREGNPQ